MSWQAATVCHSMCTTRIQREAHESGSPLAHNQRLCDKQEFFSHPYSNVCVCVEIALERIKKLCRTP